MRALLLAGFSLVSAAVWAVPFGDKPDVEFAAKLWRALEKGHFVGKEAIYTRPYIGQHPHGQVLDTIDGRLKVGGETATVIVKRNDGGEGVSTRAVANNPGKYLKAVTVMYKRTGYDPENGDWFWVKYGADGSLESDAKGRKLAGRVGKDAHKGCIACHRAAPGGDFVFNNGRIR